MSPTAKTLRMAGHAQVRAYVDAAAPTLTQPGVPRDRGRHLTAAPDHEVGRIVRAVPEHHVIAAHLGDGGTHPELDAAPLQLLRRVGMGFIGERCEQGMADVDQDDPGPGHRELRIAMRHHVMDELRE